MFPRYFFMKYLKFRFKGAYWGRGDLFLINCEKCKPYFNIRKANDAHRIGSSENAPQGLFITYW